jgi:tetratricopeptide (TPR) repeat protein
MAYTVAVDRRESTKRAWLNAAKKDSIPTAFIVDRSGRIAFIGNPVPQSGDDFEGVLRLVMAGRYDPKLQAQAEPILRAARQARKIKNWRMAQKHYDEVFAVDAKVFAPIAIERFDMVLLDMGDKDQAYAYAQTLITKFSDDPGALQMLSQKIASDPHIEAANRDLKVAMAAAMASKASAGPRDANSLAAIAQVYFVQGEIAKAVDFQKEAYFNANPRKKPEFKRTLTAYQEASQRSASVKPKADASHE